MPSPVLPEEFKAIIPAANSSLCRKLVLSLIKFPQLFYKWYSWAYKPDGTASDNFITSVGAVPLDGGGLPVGQIAVPSGVSASDGLFNDKVQVVWTAVSGAASYEIHRSLTTDIAEATLLSNPTASPYDDTAAVVGTTYHYWVKAKTAAGLVSGASFPDTGYSAATGSGGGGTVLIQMFPVSGQLVVPPGVSSIWAKLWSGGGGGGSGKASFGFAPPFGITNFGGGGGGGGEFIFVGAIPVTEGEILYFTVGSGGLAAQETDPGGTGGRTELKRANQAVIANAFGGSGGTFGQTFASSGGAGGVGGQAFEGTLLTGAGESHTGDDGLAGGTAVTPSAGAGGAGGDPSTGATNSGGTGGAGYASRGTKGGRGQIAFYK